MKRWIITVLTLTLLLTAVCGVYVQAAEEQLELTWQQGTYYDDTVNPSLESRKYTVIPLTEGEVIRFEFPTGNWGVYGYYADANGAWGYNTYTADRAVFTFEAAAINGRIPTELRLTAFHRSGNNVTITDELWETFDVKIYKSAATIQPTEATTEPAVSGVDTKITVATQNYGLWRNGVTEYAPDDKAESVAAAWRQMLRDNDADILGGQEYMQYFNVSKTMDPQECVFGELYDYQFDTGDKYTGKNIVSKTKLYDATTINFSVGSGRQYVKAYTYIDGKKICILNAHLSFEEDINVARKAQIEELISVANKERYAIILGDFNVYTADEFQLFVDAGYAIANGGAFGEFITWPNFGSTSAGNRVLDNIIVNSNIEILNVSCDRRDLSDHAMLVAQLNLKATEGGEETEPTEETQVPPEKCPHCGEDVVWEDWSGSHFITEATSGKHYRLTGNIAPDGQIQVGKTDGNIQVDVVIDTNGYNINNASRAFAVYSGSTLSLVNMDSRVSLITAAYTNSPGGVINLNPNTATGGCTLNLYGGIRIASKAANSYTYGRVIALETGVFNMYGGTVVGSETKNDGGAVYIKSADFNMYGGTIIGGTAGGGEGGAVCVDSGNFNMSGGTITGGNATNGGAVYVTRSTFTMSGGTIAGGEAVYGGALYLNMSDTSITGGTIENGKALSSDDTTPRGGNIYMYQSSKISVSISGGTITGGKAQNGNGGNIYADNAVILNFSGDAVIKDGEATRTVATNNGGGNIYMTNGTKLIMSGGTVENGTATSYGGNIYSRAHIDMTGGTIRNGVAANGGNLMVTGHNSTKTFNFSGGTIENGTATTGNIDGTAAKASYNGDNVYINSAIMNVTGGRITDDNGGNAILAFALDADRPAEIVLTLEKNSDLASDLDGKVLLISGATIGYNIGFTQLDSDQDMLWYNEVAVPGDFTGDGQVTNEDVVLLLWHTLFPQDYPLEISGDLTGDGQVTNDDVVLLLWHTLFPDEYPL